VEHNPNAITDNDIAFACVAAADEIIGGTSPQHHGRVIPETGYHNNTRRIVSPNSLQNTELTGWVRPNEVSLNCVPAGVC
jgi:hypothetical protein